MTTLRSFLAACVFVCLAWPSLGWADRRQEIVSRGILRVGTTGDYPPFSYRANATSPFVGLDIEMAGRLAAALGVQLELVPTSWPSLMKNFTAGNFDVAMSGVSITAERRTHGLFSLPYLRDGKTPITRCENQARFQTLAQIDRPGVRVVVNPGGTNERFARAHLRHATLIVWPDNTTIFDRIVQGEADQYGTIEQVRAIERGSGGSVETVMIPGISHSPHREAPEATVAAAAGFLARHMNVKNTAS